MLKGSRTLIIAVICFSFSSYTRAEDTKTEEAKALFEEAKKLYREEKYAEAADTFRKSYETKPTWRLLFNIGQCEAAAKRYDRALETFEAYMAQGGDEIPQDRQREVLEEIKRLRQMVGSLDIRADPGIVILVDDVRRGVTPLSGYLLVVSGVDHVVKAKSGDDVIFERKVRVAGGQTMTVEVTESEARDEQAVLETSTEPEEDEEVHSAGLGRAGWITVGVGGAVLAGGVVTGAMALSKNKEIEDACGGTTCPPGEDPSLEKDRDKMALITDILIPAGAVIAATGITLLIIHGVRKKEAGDASEVSARLQPIAAPGFAGFSLNGEF